MKDIETLIMDLQEDYDLLTYDKEQESAETAKIANDIAMAITLLKGQEAREPHYTTLRYLVNGIEVTTRHPECPRCIENGLWLWGAEIEKGQAYCKRCGQKVKWND